MGPITISLLRADEVDFDELASVRSQAWLSKYPDYAANIETWLDEYEDQSEHFVASLNGKYGGSARLNYLFNNGPHAQFSHVPGYSDFIADKSPPFAAFSRLAVLPEFRGMGVARSLDNARIARARDVGCTLGVIEIRADSPRLRAIAGLGFKTIPGAENYQASPFMPPPYFSEIQALYVSLVAAVGSY